LLLEVVRLLVPRVVREWLVDFFFKRRTLRRRGREIGDWVFNQRAIARASGDSHVLCLGDSHIKVLRDVSVPGARFRVRVIGGATATGVTNYGSKSGALATFTARLDRAKRWQEILIQLGEVDCGFVIWHRAKRHGLDVEEQLKFTLESYMTFLEQVATMGFRRVIVLSVPLPTIGDSSTEWGKVAYLRQEVTATQRERTALTLRFNQELCRGCKAIGVTFVDVTTGHYDAATGLLDRRFLRSTHVDHHLAAAPYAELISSELRQLWPAGAESHVFAQRVIRAPSSKVRRRRS
jgi:hypothetical protein